MFFYLGCWKVMYVIFGCLVGGVVVVMVCGGWGVGGGLVGGKFEKEIRCIGGCGVKFVGVEWYVFYFFFL